MRCCRRLSCAATRQTMHRSVSLSRRRRTPDDQERTTVAQLWWRHARWPLIAFLAAASLFAITDLYMTIARAAFFDPVSHRWLGAANWWVNEVVLTGGRWAVRVGVAFALALWIASYLDQCLQ